ncbi:unnamed protein product [Arabis nemorensis]|uniref:Mitochondrial Rho GTPase n=1 Tax=Arabis nemorensis TaxID=586526 RepID=A0A565B4I2_9BRAS|nr:unnamed protein product [Arabis nemorensis]
MTRIGARDPRGSRKPIRIVVVGEKGTGKSSLIKAALTGCLDPNIPPLLPYVNLPADCFSDRIPATIIDTSSRPEDKGKVIKEVKQADGIVLTCAFDRPETLDRLNEYWLPLIRQLEVKVPMIMAGYKVDMNEANNQISIEEITTPIMKQNREIETSIMWSAQDLEHIIWLARMVFKHAYHAVNHPGGPIYDQDTNSLKPRCVAALKRIFLLCQMDGVLSDAALNEFQIHCFDGPLKPEKRKEIREVVQLQCPLGVNEGGITWEGFLFLSTHMVEQGQIKTLWTILRKFGYNNELRLADHMIPYSSSKPEADQSVELTNDAIRFLRNFYVLCVEDNGNNLGPYEIQYLFQTAPESPWNEAPYKNAAEKNKNGGISLESFLSLWSLMTLIDPAKTLEYLIYIRFSNDPSSAIHVTRRRVLDRKEQKSERKVVQCFVFGPKNAGKSALLNRFIGRSYNDDNNNGSTEERYAVNTVDKSRVNANRKKTLVMKEIQILEENGISLSNEASASCDVAIFVFDSSDESSWKKAIDLLAEVAATSKDSSFEFPCLMVAAKTDLDPFPMAIQESTRVTQEIGIEAPIPISSKLGEFDKLFQMILAAAEHPHMSIPNIESKKERRCKLINRSLMPVSIGTASLIIGLASFRLYAARKQS